MLAVHPEVLEYVGAEEARGRMLDALKPASDLLVSQWADKHRVLSKKHAKESGDWSTDRVPFVREIMDFFSARSRGKRGVFMKGAQVAGTESANNVVGYGISSSPADGSGTGEFGNPNGTDFTWTQPTATTASNGQCAQLVGLNNLFSASASQPANQSTFGVDVLSLDGQYIKSVFWPDGPSTSGLGFDGILYLAASDVLVAGYLDYSTAMVSEDGGSTWSTWQTWGPLGSAQPKTFPPTRIDYTQQVMRGSNLFLT